MKKTSIFLATAVCFLAAGITMAAYVKAQEFYTSQDFSAGNQELDNPARGFYVQLGTNNISYLSSIREENVRLILTAFDLAPYMSCSIPDEKLQELDDFLTRMDELKMQAIFRAAYGFENTGNNDAASMEIIEGHIRQIAPVLNQHKRTIYCVQAGFFGPWGEWHSSTFLDGNTKKVQKQNRNHLLELLLNNLDESIIINVRRPRFIRDAKAAGLAVSRIGYHDDGLLASADDLGTYDDKNYSREEELRWLSQRTVGINGGEMPAVSTFTEPGTVLQEFSQIQISYLNKRYNTIVLDDWREQAIGRETALDYIQKRLGYRLYVSRLSYRETWLTGTLCVWFGNEGFSGMPKRYQASLILEKEDGTSIELPVAKKGLNKLYTLKQEEIKKITATIPESFRKTSWKLGIKIYDTLDSRNRIELANMPNEFINGVNYIDTITREEN